MALAFAFGLYLVWHAGWVILALGLASLLFGVLYTGGPFPLGYNGLGDLFVFLFFGIVAVMGTYYVNALEWSLASFWASLAVGALSVNILVVNNLRDVEQDGPAGKNTLGVLLGEDALRWEYLLMLLTALLIPCYMYLELSYGAIIFLPFLAVPFGIYLLYVIWTVEEKSRLNKTLEQTAQFMTIFGILFSTGIILS
jgi:1,4-dihydroxy-2-naphthoate octaprenyltransferase